jgi:hypothetical protein
VSRVVGAVAADRDERRSGGEIASTDLHPGAVAVLGAAAVALLLLRVPLAQTPGVWIDEAFSLYHAQQPIARLWTEGWRLESSPPLYYSLLWAWIRVVGDSEIGARLMSLGLTAVTAWVVAASARALAGRLAGAIACVVVLLPALAFEYSVEIRPYPLQLLCVALTLWGVARALVAHRARRLDGAPALARTLASIVLPAAAAFYVHTTSFAFLAALAVATAAYGLATRAGRGYAKAWLAGCAVLAVLCLPQAFMAAGVATSNRAGLAWMPPTFHLSTQSLVWRHVALGQIYWPMTIAWSLAGAVYLSILAAAWRMRARPEVLAVGAAVPLVGTLTLIAAGALQSVLMARTALWLWVPFAVLVGCAASTLSWRRWPPRIAAVAVLGLAAATTLAYLDDRPMQRPWPGVIDELGTRIGRDDRVLVLDPELGCLLERYAQGSLRTAPRGRIEPGPRPRFRGQRLDITCNRLVPVAPVTLARESLGADWVLTGDDTQRRELDALLRREPLLQATERIMRGGRPLATRVRLRPAVP